jgi:hypothetical protein
VARRIDYKGHVCEQQDVLKRWPSIATLFQLGVPTAPMPTCGLPENNKGLAEAKPKFLLVGRVGIEPTTNGLRVQATRATSKRKAKKANRFLAGVGAPGSRPNLSRT